MKGISISGTTSYCKLCKATFFCESQLKRHLLARKHRNGGIVQAFRCKICSKLLRSKCAASTHLKLVHKKKMRRSYKCAKCSSSFAYKSDLIMHSVAHMRKVRRDSATGSTSTGTSVSVQQSLSRSRVRSDVRNQNASSTDHPSKVQRIETKPFSCDVCDKSFRLRIILATHHSSTHPVQELEEESVATSANSEPNICPANRSTSSSQISDGESAVQEATTRVSVLQAIQTRIAAEEKVIEEKLREAAQLEGQIKGQKMIVEKVGELTGTHLMISGTGQAGQVDAFTAEYIVPRIDAEKGAIATKEKNLETLRQEVQSLQLKVVAWRLLLE